VSLHRRWSTVILVVAAALCPPDVRAQERTRDPVSAMPQSDKPDTYLRLLEGYRVYDETLARELGDFWEELESHGPNATDGLAKRIPIELGPLSQMALTDLALAAFARGARAVANTHLLLAQRWVDVNLTRTSSDPVQQQRQLRFAHDWYHAIIWLRFARAEGPLADTILRAARLKFPDDPEVLLSSGTFEAMEHTRMRVESRQVTRTLSQETLGAQVTPMIKRGPNEFRTREVEAIKYFTRAIQLDPSAAEARIRLAFLFTVDGPGRFDEATKLLNEAHTIDPKPPLSYLAALFAGDVEERLEHRDAAALWYRRAIADCPRAQTARLALSHLQLQLKEGLTGAQNSLRPLIGGPPHEDGVCEPDPWRNYEFGQSWRLADLIVTMRKYVREPVEGSQP
jgi:tetratricopeptide (TPR) repeat protein